MERLDLADLAREAGVGTDRIERLVKVGILHPAADGTFTAADVQRVRVVGAYEAGGIGLELLEQAILERRMSFANVGRIYPEPSPRAGVTVAQLEEALEIPGIVRQLYLALGLAQPDEAHELSVADERIVRGFVTAWRSSRGWPGSMYRAARLAGESMRRMVDGWVGLFSETIGIPPPDTVDMALEELIERVIEPGARVAELIHPAAAWLIDRNMERALNALNVESMEGSLEARGLRPAMPEVPQAVVFADLSGFTRLTEEVGDAWAATEAARLTEVAIQAASTTGGRLVKELGDGVMLVFHDANSALDGALLLCRTAADASLPPLHVGIATGPLVERDGDYYGRTVNLASRMSAAASGGEILMDGATWERLAGPHPVEPMGDVSLKGIATAIPVYRLTVDTPEAPP
ncbi:MAG TPA: adenylate/guanylate cyclase domain-containing protein [Candidatus Limnocylindria bacterium]|nr:adenylate/guanylate cyclase domain-containing protein [Candidatus Limnocylindria bacterium]